MDQPISMLRLLGGIFHFDLNFNRTFCKQTVEILFTGPDLGLHCLPMSHTKDARHMGKNNNCFYTVGKIKNELSHDLP